LAVLTFPPVHIPGGNDRGPLWGTFPERSGNVGNDAFSGLATWTGLRSPDPYAGVGERSAVGGTTVPREHSGNGRERSGTVIEPGSKREDIKCESLKNERRQGRLYE
jgi:hypothetical protein